MVHEVRVASRRAVMSNNQDLDGFMRLPEVLRVIPISRSAWWDGVREGRYPAGVKLAPRTTAWRISAIRQLCDELGGGSYE